ncbi:branched-chain amino acid ABC transporter permease [Arthrobacter sp. MI7-26]|uniref:branched-chain amino acid ABC transporter permease n=1 Tax=Arthrobacter sp. MI7-26 TaxID=2993653 RepID=UPI00224939F2|nr:branched-chain amino acid ABC transporter permease [Arthrobacter sp. MI7-26]MCX2749906.1 branched-chain amino acid ABC transporter permease [Arthrobacter sp. MI7-26]
MIPVIQSLIDATSAGAVYALAALGIGLVFGVLRLANFANGEIITGAAYALILVWPLSWPLALAASVVVAIALSLLMDLAVFRWMRSQSAASLLIASFGVSILLQRAYEGIFGVNVRTGAVAPALTRSVNVGGLRLSMLAIVAIILAAVLLIAVHFFLTKSRMGLQVQAAAANFREARILGIRSGVMIAVTLGMSGILAAAVAFVLTTQSGAVNPTFGVQATLFGLIGAVIGGLNRIGGALVGGFAVGFALSLFTTWLPSGFGDFRVALVYLLVIVVLLIAPNGIFAGRTAKERT